MRRFIIFLLVILSLVIGLYFLVRKTSQRDFFVVFMDVGQGDSAFINLKDNSQMLIDCGKDKQVLYKIGNYMPFFDRSIEYLLISHPDLDHYGGCVDVLKRYDVKNIIINSDLKSDEYFKIWQEQIKLENANIKIIKNQEKIVIASSTFHFLSPDTNLDLKSGDSNDQSIILKIENNKFSLLFMGDASIELEKALIEKYSLFLKSDVLKVGHHGSPNSSDEEFLDIVSPDKAVISVGKNSFGHPSLRVLRKLERVDAEILRTDELGDIILE